LSTTEDLVLANLGLVRAVTRPWCHPGTKQDTRDELNAAGQLGLVEAAASYDSGKGTFSSWAWRFIQSRVLDAVRDLRFHGMSEDHLRYRPKVRAHLERNPEATVEEIGQAIGVTPTQVQRVLQYRPAASLEAHDRRPLADTCAASTAGPEDTVVERLYQEEVEVALHAAVARLNERQRQAVVGYFGLGVAPATWSELAAEQGLTPETLRTRGVRALANLAANSDLRLAVG